MERADCEGLIQRGDRVLIKPNWNAINVPSSTSFAAVEAACLWAASQGAGEVIVGEGPVPVGRERIDEYLNELEAEKRLASIGARFALFDDDEHVLFREEPDLPNEIGIARLALETDVILNLPLLKVHSCCLTTLCVKNLKGCLRPEDKMAFHRVGLLPAIVALNRLVRPQINVIDAIDAMEGDHSRGPLVHLGLFIAGRDPVAVDAVGCAQIGLPPADVPLLAMAADAGLGTNDMGEIELVGEPLQPRPFALPQDYLASTYPDLEILDGNACSACRGALMDGLYIAGGDRKLQTIALGGDAEPPAGALALGDCLAEYASTHTHVEGCPPSGHAIAQALTQGSEESGQ